MLDGLDCGELELCFEDLESESRGLEGRGLAVDGLGLDASLKLFGVEARSSRPEDLRPIEQIHSYEHVSQMIF